ncbi:MAG TPA: sigma-70 family RNA polymerase sigma factor [Bryobacteraceae bacterium]|nr:sigma-70 family RNA polymerase sigma factor [Bryobacteraceae bacterium]
MMTGGEHTEPTFSGLARYLDGLYGYAMTLTRNPTESEDLVQETYLRALRAKDQLRPESNIKSWLFTILRNIWLNQMRRTRNGPRIDEFDETAVDSRSVEGQLTNDPLDSYLAKLKHADLRSAIEGLPKVYQEVVLLRDFEDLSYRQIAEVLGCPDGTVMSRLGRAREKLRLALQHWAPPRQKDSNSCVGRIDRNASGSAAIPLAAAKAVVLD